MLLMLWTDYKPEPQGMPEYPLIGNANQLQNPDRLGMTRLNARMLALYRLAGFSGSRKNHELSSNTPRIIWRSIPLRPLHNEALRKNKKDRAEMTRVGEATLCWLRQLYRHKPKRHPTSTIRPSFCGEYDRMISGSRPRIPAPLAVHETLPPYGFISLSVRDRASMHDIRLNPQGRLSVMAISHDL
ncbi:uncharacterized protein BO97DRAFT_74386 [Aspergillus homomorphus CBS 101889]|uniref:Uncharacterized protein n=1 Tax=Aspergillus homomorphus (strain CBS 101889) TaxID=1450537 RepID=A0A395IEX3_ASPHC|nr:hypothetical protein BO97DRAFT_74386 [Aspergillus homomorphus CBS 101889]RAL16724.1 hypothetical protein BO97DRAFT_74386 [Aspergillus homomorphus CBS 101889]